MKCYIRKHLPKKAPKFFFIHVQDFNISDMFYKIQNLKKKRKIMKAVIPFLPINFKLHSTFKFKVSQFCIGRNPFHIRRNPTSPLKK